MPHIFLGSKGRVFLRTNSSEWHPGLPAECKMIAGATWRKTEKVWSYPLTMTTLRRMRQVFGTELEVEPALWEWAKTEVRTEKTLKKLATVHDAELRVVPKVFPKLAEAMSERKYQRSAARFAATAGSYLLADEPGLGKTASTLAGLLEAEAWHGEHLVLAPKTSLKSVWARQIELWTPGALVFVMPEGRAKREAVLAEFMAAKTDGPKFLICNYEMVRRRYGHLCLQCKMWQEDVENRHNKIKFPLEHHTQEHQVKRTIRTDEWPAIVDHKWESVILDESHNVLSTYTNQAKQNMVQAGAFDLKASHRFPLTGTPLRGEERRLWGTLSWIDRKTFSAYWNFIGSFFETKNNGFGMEIMGIDESMREEFERTIDRYVLRRTRAEVRPELPIGQRVDIVVEMTPKHKKQYQEFEVMGESELESGTVSGQGTLSELTRLQQMAFGVWDMKSGKLLPTQESAKLDWIEQFLWDRGITTKGKDDWLPEAGSAYKYVIASKFTDVLDAVERRLTTSGIKVDRIDGNVSQSKRDKVMVNFQADTGTSQPRVVLIQTKTGGVAIELDAWCDEMIILDETYIADDQVQLEGRINNRSGRISPRTWYYLRTAETIDTQLAQNNFNQHNLQHLLLDGRRGVDVALHMIRGKKAA